MPKRRARGKSRSESLLADLAFLRRTVNGVQDRIRRSPHGSVGAKILLQPANLVMDPDICHPESASERFGKDLIPQNPKGRIQQTRSNHCYQEDIVQHQEIGQRLGVPTVDENPAETKKVKLRLQQLHHDVLQRERKLILIPGHVTPPTCAALPQT